MFYLLARIVDVFFVQSLELISKRLQLSSDIAGATFMAVGSSAPELFVSLLALFRVSEEMSIGSGTIVGSAIFNILVIIGASALYRRAYLTWQPVIRDLAFYIAAILLLLYVFLDGSVTLSDGLIFVVFYVVYLFSFGIWRKLFKYETKADVATDVMDEALDPHTEIRSEPTTWKNITDKLLAIVFIDLGKKPNMYGVNFLISVFLIGICTHFMVESAVYVAHFFGVPSVIIGLTILAAGTSIPDLLASINVAKKGFGDMAISNAVGSNIFDIAIGLGLPWVLIILWRGQPLQVETENLSSSIFLLFATVVALLFLLIARKWELGRYAGILLIGSYITYILFQIGFLSMNLCFNIFGGYCIIM